MRILFLSAFYPPNEIGGWEQLVRDINIGLQERGHHTHVLTSVHGLEKPAPGEEVDRLLTLESNIYHYSPFQFLSHSARLKNNLSQTETVIKAFKPDVVFVHVMWNLSKGVAWIAEQLCPGRVVYYIANDWPYATDVHTAYWRAPANHRFTGFVKQLIAPIPLHLAEQDNKKFVLDFCHVMCVSQAIKNNLAAHAQIDPNQMRVVYNGVEVDQFFPPGQRENSSKKGLSLLYAGSLVPHKGVHTAIEALGILNQRTEKPEVTLSLVGSGHPEYEAYLNKLVSEHQLMQKVHFLGRVPRNEMPELFRKFDVLVFPSIWEEPLARVMQEAMASGLTVLGTLTGGTGELLMDGDTGLAFEPENANMLAQKIEQLYNDRALCAKLAESGRNKVLVQFNFEHMVDEIEQSLKDVVEKNVTFLGRK